MTKPSRYTKEIIPIEEKDRLFSKYASRFIFEEKADIYGCCIKLITDQRYVKERWEDNFYPMSANIRSHGRLIVTNEDEIGEPRVIYEPISKTAFVLNVDYYGWIKSIALSIAGDITEDAHYIYPVHGACIDLGGCGISLIAPSGTGKTTHTYGLLRLDGVRVVADDWFFVRLQDNDAIAFSSEKNFYVQADIANIWGEYQRLIENVEFDSRGRAIINVKSVIGKGKILPLTTVRGVIILKRDVNDKVLIKRIESEEAVDYMERTNFCNPHLLVVNERKTRLRSKFFKDLFGRVQVFMINAVPPPLETHRMICEAISKITSP
ncbi:MAG: aldolase [Nitrososphaerota archaeon]|nr:hypothetical protein [Nitrososphaerales archaeon]MDW8044838.1 aldolase [Nitrososphaerota archaeon]